MLGKNLAFFGRVLERQQENGLLINPEPFAAKKIKPIETKHFCLKRKNAGTIQKSRDKIKKPSEFSNGFCSIISLKN
jgi:hypothetical protein